MNTPVDNHPTTGFRGDSASHSADEAAIRALFGRLVDAWGRGHGDTYSALFTDDADYVAFDGTHTKGRTAIAASHQALFDTHLKGTRLTGTISTVKFVAPDVALVHASGGTIMRGRSTPSPERDSIQTLLAIKRSGTWRFTAFHAD